MKQCDLNIQNLIDLLKKDELVKSVFVISKLENIKSSIETMMKEKIDSDREIRDDFRNIILNYTRNSTYDYYETDKARSIYDAIELIKIDILEKELLGDFNIILVAYLKVLLVLYLSLGYITIDWCKENPPIGNQPYFRGQSDFSYSLVPSIYRNLNYNGTVDDKFLFDLYNKEGFVAKYNRIFSPIHNLNYQFVAFMQHAASFSPFIDFTNRLTIAEIFATEPSNKNKNNYSNTDASLFVFYPNVVKNDDVNFSKHNVQFFKNKLQLDSVIFGKKLLFCKLTDFLVEFQFFTNATNDRMRYQHGSFLYINKCVIANGRLFFPFSQGYFVKYRIYAKKNISKSKLYLVSKEDVYNQVCDLEPFHDEKHLMDPYLYFTEYTK